MSGGDGVSRSAEAAQCCSEWVGAVWQWSEWVWLMAEWSWVSAAYYAAVSRRLTQVPSADRSTAGDTLTLCCF